MENRKNQGLNETTPVAVSTTVGPSKELVLRYNHCNICDSRLHFSYVTDYSRNMTEEHVKCPECGLKVRQVSHRLQ